MKKAKSMRAVCQSSKIVDNNVNQSCCYSSKSGSTPPCSRFNAAIAARRLAFKRRSATRASAPQLPPQPKASFVLWDFAKNWDDCFDHFALSWGISLIETRRALLFSGTCWPRDHYDCAALLTSMNGVALLLGGLHCHQADRAWLRRLRLGQRPVHARLQSSASTSGQLRMFP
jgi:hypothetical protein